MWHPSPVPRQAALLRGINIGPSKRVSMAHLRELVAALGYTDVETLVQSGNVVFSGADRPARAAARIEEALLRETGLDVPVIGRTGAELAAIVRRDPLPGAADDPKRYHVVFLSAKPAAALARSVDPERYLPEAFHVQGREVYVRWPAGAQKARLTHAFWERTLKVRATARNWNTVAKLADMTAG